MILLLFELLALTCLFVFDYLFIGILLFAGFCCEFDFGVSCCLGCFASDVEFVAEGDFSLFV